MLHKSKMSVFKCYFHNLFSVINMTKVNCFNRNYLFQQYNKHLLVIAGKPSCFINCKNKHVVTITKVILIVFLQNIKFENVSIL